MTNLSPLHRSLSLRAAQEKSSNFFTARLCFGSGGWPAVTLALLRWLFDSPRCNKSHVAAAALTPLRMVLQYCICQTSAGPQARGGGAAPS